MIKEPICVYINSKHSAKIMRFAEQVSMTTNYSDCNQTNYNLKVYQHYIGKLGELAVFLYLRQEGYNITEPDFKIYQSKDKSWDSDLKINDLHISIKTQDIESAKRFGLSWTFQHIKNGRKDFTIKENPIVIPTLYDNFYYNKIRIIIFPSIEMKNIKFGEPKKESLKGKKLVMYAEDNYNDINKWMNQFDIS
jgi:hypothetical protein